MLPSLSLNHAHPPTPPVQESRDSRVHSSSQPPQQLPVLPVTYPLGAAPSHERRNSLSLSIAPLLINQLKTGSIFLKHGSRGSPHYRYVWLSSDLKFIHWGDLKSHRIHGSLACDSLMTLLRGHSSQLFLQRAPKNSNPQYCFSLQSTARTLDLECSNEQERDLWAKAFDYLIMVVKGKLPLPNPLEGDKQENGAVAQPSLVQALEILSSNYEANLNNGTAHVGTAIGQLPATLTEIQEEVPSQSSAARSRPRLPSHQINNLYGWLDEAQAKIEKLEKENELYKEDNRKLMIIYAKKMIKLQETIDQLRHENQLLTNQSSGNKGI
jgi:hypothetical protein